MASSQEDLNIWQSMDQIIRKIIDNCGPWHLAVPMKNKPPIRYIKN